MLLELVEYCILVLEACIPVVHLHLNVIREGNTVLVTYLKKRKCKCLRHHRAMPLTNYQEIVRRKDNLHSQDSRTEAAFGHLRGLRLLTHT